LHKQHGKMFKKATTAFLCGLFEYFLECTTSDIQKTRKTAMLFTLRESR
jgi:hypothetical protein